MVRAWLPEASGPATEVAACWTKAGYDDEAALEEERRHEEEKRRKKKERETRERKGGF